MTKPGDTIIHGAPFRVTLERVINLGNYESTRIGLAVDFMDVKPNDAFKMMQEILAPWVEELRPKRASEPAQPTKKTAEGKASKTCRYCGGMIYWEKDPQQGWVPVNPDGSRHRCDKKP